MKTLAGLLAATVAAVMFPFHASAGFEIWQASNGRCGIWAAGDERVQGYGTKLGDSDERLEDVNKRANQYLKERKCNNMLWYKPKKKT